VETKLAADINGFPFQLKEPGMLMLFSTVRMEQSLDSARWAMEKSLDATRTATFTDEEVNRAKASMLKDIEIELNNSSASATTSPSGLRWATGACSSSIATASRR